MISFRLLKGFYHFCSFTFDNNQCLTWFLFTIHMVWLIGFTRTLFFLFCDTGGICTKPQIKVLCFCVISSIVLMCGFYFNMLSGLDCAFQCQAQAVLFGRLIMSSVYT